MNPDIELMTVEDARRKGYAARNMMPQWNRPAYHGHLTYPVWLLYTWNAEGSSKRIDNARAVYLEQARIALKIDRYAIARVETNFAYDRSQDRYVIIGEQYDPNRARLFVAKSTLARRTVEFVSKIRRVIVSKGDKSERDTLYSMTRIENAVAESNALEWVLGEMGYYDGEELTRDLPYQTPVPVTKGTDDA